MVYTIDEIREKIVPVAKKYNLSAVYLFGSYARGEADESSDVDLAYDDLDDRYDIMSLVGEVSNIFSEDVDFLDMDRLLSPSTNVGQLVKRNFLRERILLYKRK
ncbi:nucleotidyltransferase family protein [Streptococcus fryi]